MRRESRVKKLTHYCRNLNHFFTFFFSETFPMGQNEKVMQFLLDCSSLSAVIVLRQIIKNHLVVVLLELWLE
jgi:hypothetical protein